MTVPGETENTTFEHARELPQRRYELTPQFLEGLAQFERGKPLGWGATPQGPYLPQIAEQQKEVRRYNDSLFANPPFAIPVALQQFMYHCNLGRVTHRLDKNFDSFSNRVQFDLSETPIELHETQDRVLTGNASSAEIIVISEILGEPAYELASTTHPYGYRIEELEPMRRAVNDGILYVGGEVYEEPEVEFKVKNGSHLDKSDTENPLPPSLLMTRTKTLGKINDDTTVYERSSFVYLLSEAEFEAISTVEFGRGWHQHILGNKQLITSVKRAVDQNDYERALPLSTTAWAVNERLVKSQLLDKDAYRLRQRQITTLARQESEYAALAREGAAQGEPPRSFVRGWLSSFYKD